VSSHLLVEPYIFLNYISYRFLSNNKAFRIPAITGDKVLTEDFRSFLIAKSFVFCYVTRCGLVHRYHFFRETHCSCFQHRHFLQNGGKNFSPNTLVIFYRNFYQVVLPREFQHIFFSKRLKLSVHQAMQFHFSKGRSALQSHIFFLPILCEICRDVNEQILHEKQKIYWTIPATVRFSRRILYQGASFAQLISAQSYKGCTLAV
jgi:hypothetical protein